MTWPLLAIAALTTLAYANAFQGGFVLDSLQLVVRDARVHAWTPNNLRLIVSHTYWWPLGESGLYRPVTTLSFLFNYAIAGNAEHPFGYHALNLGLHLVNVCLAYGLLRSLVAPAAALAVAVLWAVHPLATEAVTNIAGRADLLATASVLGGLLAYLRAQRATGAARLFWLITLAMLLLIGALAKESAVALAALVACSELAQWRTRSSRSRFEIALALALPLLVLWQARAIVIGGAPEAEFPYTDNPLVGEGWVVSRATALAIGARYLLLLIWPARLSADYSYPAILPVATGTAYAILAAASLIAGALAALFRSHRLAFGCAVAAIITWLPASNLVFTSGTIMAERSLYLPSLALIASALLVAQRVVSRIGPRATTAAVVAIALALAGRTFLRNRDWQSDVTLWTATIADTPRSAKAHRALAEAIYTADPQRQQIDRVISEAEMATALLSSLPDERNDYQSFRQAGAFRIDRAHARESAASAAPSNAAARDDFGKALEHLARAAAIARVQAARYGDPATNRFQADIARLQAVAHLGLDNRSEALAAAERTTERDPLNGLGYRLLAQASIANNDPDNAAIQLMIGGLVTGDREFTQDLANLYRAGLDREGCALVAAGGQAVALNSDCGVVRAHSCAAARKVRSVALALGRAPLAEAAATLSQRFSCPP